MKGRVRYVVLAAAMAALPALALAHDLWIERSPGGFVLRAGHPDAPLRVDVARVTEVRCRRAGQEGETKAAPVQQGRDVAIPAACDVVLACVDHGSWSLTPDGEVNRPRSEVPEAVKAWQSRACAKWVDAQSPAGGEPLGAELELVPAKPLAPVRAGDKIALRVLSGGAPVNGAAVSIGHRAIGETDRHGEVRVRVREAGLQVLTASFRKPLQSPDADALVLEASLAFVVAR